MSELLAMAIAFPTVVFTVPLGVVLLYWLFVMLGAAHIDVLGGGDHAGLLDGGDHFEIGDGADVGDVGVDGAHDGFVPAFVEALRLRSAPATVVLSLLVVFSWLASVFGVQLMDAYAPSFSRVIAGALIVLVAPLLGLAITSFAIRPLAKLFIPHRAAGRSALLGKVCVVRTGSVDHAFGEATLEDGGAGLVVRVRVDGGSELRRGDQALIVAWDEEHDAFTIAPMDEVMPPKRKG